MTTRKRIVVDYNGQPLARFPVGTPYMSYNDTHAFEYLICRDADDRVFSVETRQRLFRETPLRVRTKRIPGRRGEVTAENCARLSAAVAAAFGGTAQ